MGRIIYLFPLTPALFSSFLRRNDGNYPLTPGPSPIGRGEYLVLQRFPLPQGEG